MIFDPRIGAKALAALSRRVGMSYEAGVDMRTIWQREAERSWPMRHKALICEVSDSITRGVTLTDALSKTGDFFPPLWREMVAIGEESGRLQDVLRNLAEQYEFQISMWRSFRQRLAWPMIQLVGALTVIGVFIGILGMLPEASRNSGITDLTFGLYGAAGVRTYLMYLAMIAAAVWFFIFSVRRGLLWVKPIQRVLLALPVVGSPLRTLAISRLAWSMSLTLGSGMDVLRALPLAFRSTLNAYFTDHIDQTVRHVRSGDEVTGVLASTRAFPQEFLDAIEVGERSGRLPETMALLSRQYQEQAQGAMATLATFGSYSVWALIALAIIMAIMRMATFYVDMLNDASRI